MFLFQLECDLCDSCNRRGIAANPHNLLPGCHLPQGEKVKMICGCGDGKENLSFNVTNFLNVQTISLQICIYTEKWVIPSTYLVILDLC